MVTRHQTRMYIFPVHWIIDRLLHCQRKKKELDVTNDSILMSESLSLSKDYNATGYVIPVVILILILLVFGVFGIIYYKKSSKFRKWSPQDNRNNKKTDGH
jgi:hypothetical protein